MPADGKYLDREDIIHRNLSNRIYSESEQEKMCNEIYSMTDEQFMREYNPYYIITPGKEDTVWYNYQSDLLKGCKFSLHPALIKFGTITSRRFYGTGLCGYKEKMKLLCICAEHVGNCYFKFTLKDVYGTIISQPINFSPAMLRDMMGKLLEVECTFSDNGVMITDIKTILPYDEKKRLAGEHARYVG